MSAIRQRSKTIDTYSKSRLYHPRWRGKAPWRFNQDPAADLEGPTGQEWKQGQVTPRTRSAQTDTVQELEGKFRRGTYPKQQPVHPNWNRPRLQVPLDLNTGRGRTEEPRRPTGTWPNPTPTIPTPPVIPVPDLPGIDIPRDEDLPVPVSDDEGIPDEEEPEEPLDKPKDVAKLCSDDPMDQLLYKLPPCGSTGAQIQITTKAKFPKSKVYRKSNNWKTSRQKGTY